MYDFKHVPQVAEMTDEYMERLYEQTLEKVLSEQTHNGRPLARSAHAAKERLNEVYGEQYGDNLLGTWLKLACLGEGQVKKTYKPSRYYEHIKKLKEAGCSWRYGDPIYHTPNEWLEEFTPSHNDRRRVMDVLPEVQAAIGRQPTSNSNTV